MMSIVPKIRRPSTGPLGFGPPKRGDSCNSVIMTPVPLMKPEITEYGM